MLGKLCHAAWETVRELIAEATSGDVRPGMVAAVHTASSDLRWHPHVHALVSRGGWDRGGTWPRFCSGRRSYRFSRRKTCSAPLASICWTRGSAVIRDSRPIRRSPFGPMTTMGSSGSPAACCGRPFRSSA
ncbi:MAG: transposase [Acidobacteria bacterium]|nr:transposase [Acidobacteriota bacterium]